MRCTEEPVLTVEAYGDKGVGIWCGTCEFEETLGFTATVADAADARIRHSIREIANPHPALEKLQEKFIYPNQTSAVVDAEHKPEFRWI